MTADQELMALAERCEREEPSRELDRAIAAALGYEVEVITIPEGHPMADVFKEGSGLEFMYRPGCDREAIPPWTHSLDAAVTLVPEGLEWNVHFKNVDLARPSVFVGDDLDWSSDGEARTVALALCAAALRARATLKGEA